MAREVNTNEYLDMVCQLLTEGSRGVPVPVRGTSMRPFLRDGDRVWLDPVEGEIRPGDILLYRRPSGQYILHRVIRVEGQWLAMLGDSQLGLEPLEASRVRAIAVRASCKGKLITPKSLRWRFYRGPWRWLAPARKYIFSAYGWIKGLGA